MANSNAQYGILSTFERSWICKIEKDKNGEFKDTMQITDPYGTSQHAAKKFKDLENQPFLKVASVVFFLCIRQTRHLRLAKKSILQFY